jgi:hypothetical protein
MWNVGKLSFGVSIEIILLLSGVMLVSWIFHSCRTHVTSKTDSCQNNTTVPSDCELCPKSNVNLNMINTNIKTSGFADHLLSQFAVILVITYILPLKYPIKATIRAVSLIAIILLLLADANEYVQFIPSFVLTVFIFNPLTLINTSYINREQMVGTVMLSVFSIAAFLLFVIPKNKYWLYHSLWHIFGAISATFAILLATSFYDVPKTKFGSSLYHSICDSTLLSPIKIV